jgi:hypothetical protein
MTMGSAEAVGSRRGRVGEGWLGPTEASPVAFVGTAEIPQLSAGIAAVPYASPLCRLCCKSPSWTSDAQMLSIHLKWDFLRRRPEECDSSKKANQNQDSSCGSTPNLKESAGRLLQQNLPHPDIRSSAFDVAKRQRLLQKLSRIEHTARDAGGLFAED